ncbi:hypothetical protein BDF19DRAFT_440103 [Syncephalis fuscata]|nr:hypothetical protein BDF19DRAFT_440103 [Syncephalis fuscata]
MLSKTNYLLSLLVLLSVGQSIAALPNNLDAKDFVSEYQLGQPGAFGIKSLVINKDAVKKEGAYVMEGKYIVDGSYRLNARVICRNEPTKYLPFRFYQEMYSGDFNMFESNSLQSPFYSVIKKFTLDKGYLCYMTANSMCKKTVQSYRTDKYVEPQVAKSRLLNFISLIKDMKAKGWLIISAVSSDGCIDDNRITFSSIDRMSPMDTAFPTIDGRVNDNQIIMENERLWMWLAYFYLKTEPSLRYLQALKDVKDKYKDLAISITNPPFNQNSRP